LKKHTKELFTLETTKTNLLLATRLLEKEVIFKEILEKIFGKRPFEKDVAEEAGS